MIQYDDTPTYVLIKEEDIPNIANALRDFLYFANDGALTDYILEFCSINNYRIEEIGDIIRKNSNFKHILQMDCEVVGIFRQLDPVTPEEIKRRSAVID